MIRAFVAIEMPEDLRHELSESIAALGRLGADVRLSRPESVHLTLKFLGDIEEHQVVPIGKALSELAGNQAAFRVRIGGLGAFPYLANPRVIWIGVDGGSPLQVVQGAVEERLAPLGFPPEKRPFQPHLTLARVKSRHNVAALIHYVESHQAEAPAGEFVARQLHLYQSLLRPEGAQYRKLVTADLIQRDGTG
ncbi:MAG: RNA 2',3'-cyclic phosphodiesterase [Acidobacteriota bacterium]